MLRVLDELEARYRDPAGRRFCPDAALLLGKGHHLLETGLGPLDLLGEVAEGRGFEDLAPDANAYSLGDESILVLDLASLIELKMESGREKDLAALPLLRKTLDERSRR